MNHILRNATRLSLSRSARKLSPLTYTSGVNVSRNSGAYISQRFNSGKVDKSSAVDASSALPDVSASVDSTPLLDAAASIAVNLPEPGMVSGAVMSFLENCHTMLDIPYWGAIVLTTIGIRVCLLPVAIKTIQGSARMAVMRPEMQKVQDMMTKDPNKDDQRVTLRYQNEMKALFIKHKVNPLRAVLWPLFQFPVFIAFFMALKEMGTYYPGFATGGAAWFSNLAAADPYLILPLFNSLSFLLMVEMGADGINAQQQKTFQNVMRGLAVVMVPLTMDMPSGLFVYWCTNNMLSLIQTGVLKKESIRVALDIPKPPAAEDNPAMKLQNPFKIAQEMLEKERTQKSNARAEILEGVAAPPGPPSTPPPVTFAMPPRQARRPKASSADPKA